MYQRKKIILATAHIIKRISPSVMENPDVYKHSGLFLKVHSKRCSMNRNSMRVIFSRKSFKISMTKQDFQILHKRNCRDTFTTLTQACAQPIEDKGKGSSQPPIAADDLLFLFMFLQFLIDMQKGKEVLYREGKGCKRVQLVELALQ